jgi:hypothetical protein
VGPAVAHRSQATARAFETTGMIEVHALESTGQMYWRCVTGTDRFNMHTFFTLVSVVIMIATTWMSDN